MVALGVLPEACVECSPQLRSVGVTGTLQPVAELGVLLACPANDASKPRFAVLFHRDHQAVDGKECDDESECSRLGGYGDVPGIAFGA